MRLRASTKIAIGAAAAFVAVPIAYKVVTDRMILGEVFTEIKPGRATLLGIDSGSGYHIVVANEVAALVPGGADRLGTGDMSGSGSDADTHRKLPIEPMLEVLQGNSKRLGAFIMAINQIKAEDADVPGAAVWDAGDVAKAVQGDAKLRRMLESDLNVRLDGTPLDVVREGSIMNGIVLRIPVPVNVTVAGAPRKMVGEVLEPYRPRFAMDLESRKFSEQRLTKDMIRGYYFEEAKKVITGVQPKENVAASLKSRFSPQRMTELASAPEEILSKAKVILNEGLVENARMDSVAGDSGKATFKLVMNLTDEGRRRLWQYSKLRRGSQLLFVVNGMAIAAPVVGSEIPQAEVTITNLPDGDIVKDAVETINRYAQGKGNAK